MDLDIHILYEDNEVLAIDKPAGLVVHADGRSKVETLADWVLKKYPSIYGVGETISLTTGGVIEKWGIVHRIDRETSGVLLIAKTQESFLNLKKQFQDRTIKKAYCAISHGFFKEKEGSINRPIGRSTTDFRKRSAEFGARGDLREAVTDYRVLGEGKTGDLKLSYLEVFPHTGRTHQIRVHLKAISHPILCDTLYAPKLSCLPAMGRVALHAHEIAFQSLGGAPRKVTAPLPSDFKEVLAELGIVC
jgi:23S rRNA pseudouridine1911/1915/1917 synthase